MERIVAALGVPCAAMVPLDDRIRPPGAGLWTAMMHLTPFVSSSLSRPLSLIVGEAGGREGDSHDGSGLSHTAAASTTEASTATSPSISTSVSVRSRAME